MTWRVTPENIYGSYIPIQTSAEVRYMTDEVQPICKVMRMEEYEMKPNYDSNIFGDKTKPNQDSSISGNTVRESAFENDLG